MGKHDTVVTEEPLELRLSWPGHPATRVSVTMRTPGADFELAAGYMLAEGVLAIGEKPRSVAYCVDRTLSEEQRYNVVTVDLDAPPRRHPSVRTTTMTSACGVCGTESLDEVFAVDSTPVKVEGAIAPAVVSALPDLLRERQPLFAKTGSIHASGVFGFDGESDHRPRGHRSSQHRRQSRRGPAARHRRLRRGVGALRQRADRVRHRDEGRLGSDRGRRRRSADRRASRSSSPSAPASRCAGSPAATGSSPTRTPNASPAVTQGRGLPTVGFGSAARLRLAGRDRAPSVTTVADLVIPPSPEPSRLAESGQPGTARRLGSATHGGSRSRPSSRAGLPSAANRRVRRDCVGLAS